MTSSGAKKEKHKLSQECTDNSRVETNEREKTLERWMREALTHAQNNLERGEVPVGCLFIHNNRILAVGANDVNETKNPTRHAEMTCIDKVLQWCKEKEEDYRKIFSELDVVVTVEPCIMCASALHHVEVRSIVYGAANSRFGGCTSVLDASKIHDGSKVQVIGGIFADEAVQLLKQFYEGTNPNAPNPKVKKRKIETDVQWE